MYFDRDETRPPRVPRNMWRGRGWSGFVRAELVERDSVEMGNGCDEAALPCDAKGVL